MDLGISGRHALVCGASKGLGFGCAQALAREGVHVVLAARGEQGLQDALARLRSDAAIPPDVAITTVVADVTTAQGRAAALDACTTVDILVTNAGGPPHGDFRSWQGEDWIRALQANMLAPIELIRATIDAMAERGFGRVVNITSSAVKMPIASLGLSNGARAGLTGFIAGLARTPRYAGANVTVNNLLPGAFATDRLRGAIALAAKADARTPDEVAQARQQAIPSQRFGTSEEFGAACAYLCSAHAGYITGQNMLIDGGAYPGTF